MWTLDVTFLVILKSLAIILGFSNWRLLPLAYRLVLSVTLLSLIIEIIGRYIAVVLHQSNVHLFNAYALVQMLLLGVVGVLLVRKKTYRKIILLLLVTETTHWIWYALNVNINRLYNWFFVFSSLALVTVFIMVLIENTLFKKQKIFEQPVFLISLAYMIFYGSTVPLFGVMNVLTETDMSIASALFNINKIANILCYVLIGIAFYLYGKQAGREYVRQ